MVSRCVVYKQSAQIFGSVKAFLFTFVQSVSIINIHGDFPLETLRVSCVLSIRHLSLNTVPLYFLFFQICEERLTGEQHFQP